MSVSSNSAQRLKLLVQGGQLHHLGGQILVVAGVLLISSVLLLGVNVSGLQKSFGWVQETDGELIQISNVEKQLVSLELSVRGYALTEDPVFLRYIATEKRALDDAMKTLASTMSDDPEPVTRPLHRLKGLVDKRVRQFSNMAEPGNAAKVAATIRDADYRTTMRETRAVIAQMRTSELAELADLEAGASGQARRTFGLAVCMMLLAFAFGVAGLACMRFGRSRP